MSIAVLKDRLPAFAKDVRLNLGALADTESLTPQQLWGTLLCAAASARNAEVLKAVAEEARIHLDDDAFAAARAAASIMAMNNVYYRFVHHVENDVYGSMPARLRMQVIARPGVDKLDFELWSLAASVIHGCGACTNAHENKALQRGASPEMVQDVARAAAILHAAAVTLDGEAALDGRPAATNA